MSTAERLLSAAKPGMRSAILDELLPRVPEVRASDGCISYIPTIDAAVVGPMHVPTEFGPDTFVIVETWESVEHLVAHSNSAMAKEYFKIIEPLLASYVDHFLDPVSSSGYEQTSNETRR